ncbi:hypothetical protein [Novosphingobium sp. Gsoil 351]|uniref:hypothetical protein n=1 Tax=Novosphingobium sp. Gsoil 351 TaxID=2675225 RepID=UPI0012B46384|nr:hypothetical protein [Novosphingobium sp. Gsoil 351]QGN54168.1 hypothetical protein GKE62_06030 [Novosphingobium sp. Gsoil 351]
MDRLSDPSHTSVEWRLRVAGAAPAADAVTANFDWERVSAGLSKVARENGLPTETATPILAEAWRWGRQNPTAWMMLPRWFIWDQVADTLFNVNTGERLCPEQFDQRVDKYCPLSGFGMTEFLIAEDLIYRVEAIERDPTIAKQFFIRDDLLVFNYA